MYDERYVIDEEGIADKKLDEWYCWKEVVELLNEKQAVIEEYEDFCYNLCMFLLSKDLDDEYRKKYGKEYKFLRLGGYSK